MRVAGVMSGTSLDGIDVAVVDISGRGWAKRLSVLAHSTTPYRQAVRDAILSVSNRETHTAAIARLHFLLAELYAEAVRATCHRAGIPLASLDLIGCHGQTIFHEGQPARFLGRRVASTLQIGEGSLIAERTGVAVISDFRPRDIAAGGRGAPLVPYLDYLLLRHRRRGRIALNLGGIANITAIPPGGASQDVVAFDTGPGNMAIDALAVEYTRGRWSFDRGGRIAARGQVSQALLDELLADGFYRRRPPKTAGREQYGREFVARLRATGLPIEDLVATATALTAAAVAAGVARFVRPRMAAHDLIVSGGGAHNPRLMAYLAAFLPGLAVRSSAEFGLPVDAKEAIAFAVLAAQSLGGRTANLPSATGARRAVVLGKLAPR